MRTVDGTTLAALQEYLAGRLAKHATEPLNRQIYLQIRDAILHGPLSSGMALPSSRALAESLGLGRNTVLHAYGQLEAEGYIASRAGAGTFVADLDNAPPVGHQPAQTPHKAFQALSKRGETVLYNLPPTYEDASNAHLRTGLPDLSAFPWKQWQRILHKHQRACKPSDLGYMGRGGHPALKASIARYLSLSRGVNCTPDQILITHGMQQALLTIALTLADSGDQVWLEEPGYMGVRLAFLAAGLDVHPVPVDADGMQWSDALPSPRLIYVTPSHQYPTGAVMSLARRQALLAEATRRGAWIIEDDYDSEFRHSGRPIAALQGLDKTGRVIYLGTFSKMLFPALQLGYLVVPPDLAHSMRRLQARLMREGSYLEQAALADFIDEGHFGAHLRHMRVTYARRQGKLRQTLVRELGEHFTEQPAHFDTHISLLGGAAGMHVLMRLPKHVDDSVISGALHAAGVHIAALSRYCLSTPPFPGLILGYANEDDATLTLAVVKLARLLKELVWPNSVADARRVASPTTAP
ncbi:MAG: PLP-dependent aminotransferase family protein [Burkholderiales bacterium]|nr:PLP-dependent aminotransferase family protein [Burkholderiales bacterium]